MPKHTCEAVIHPGTAKVSIHMEHGKRKYHVGLRYDPSIPESVVHEKMCEVAALLRSIGAYGGQEWEGRALLEFCDDRA